LKKDRIRLKSVGFLKVPGILRELAGKAPLAFFTLSCNGFRRSELFCLFHIEPRQRRPAVKELENATQ